MKTIIPILLFILLSCTSRTTDKENPEITNAQALSNTGFVWTKLLDSAAWKKSYNFQMFSFRDSLWTFHPDGNWFSTDGIHWTKSTLTNAIHNLAFLDYIEFKNTILGLGHFEGNIERFTFKPEIYSTTDLKKWDTVSKNSNLPARFFYHPFVFENKIWIIGGEDKYRQYADVWNSVDGITWTKQRDHLPFGNRSGNQIVSLNNKLYLIGYDVWSSKDAINWDKVTDAIVKGEQVSGTAVVYDNKIWLLGCNRNGKFTSGVLYSSDGKTWKTQDAPWSPRGGIAATVFKDKIIMTGGKYGGFMKDGVTTEFVYSNDVWIMEKK